MTNRRLFLVRAGVTAIAGTLPGGIALAQSEAGSGTDSRSSLVGAKFHLFDLSGQTAQVTLTAINVKPLQADIDQFSLQFKGSKHGPAAEGIYRLSNRIAGEFELFLIPDTSGRTISYRADVSLLHKQRYDVQGLSVFLQSAVREA